jgi:class 3 adenylate cyclase
VAIEAGPGDDSPDGLLLKSLQDRQAGVAVLVDIIDSTGRKQEITNWKQQTEMVYSLFDAMVDRQASTFKAQLTGHTPYMVRKHIGDGLFAFHGFGFVPRDTIMANPAFSSICRAVLADVTELRNNLWEDDRLDRLSVKVIIALLTEVATYREKVGGEGVAVVSDVLGNDIDLTFRLEKFGDAGHIIVNDLFHGLVQESLAESDYRAIKAERLLKGFKKPEKFWALTNIEGLKQVYETKLPSNTADHIYVELIKELISSQRSNGKTLVPGEFMNKEGGR